MLQRKQLQLNLIKTTSFCNTKLHSLVDTNILVEPDAFIFRVGKCNMVSGSTVLFSASCGLLFLFLFFHLFCFCTFCSMYDPFLQYDFYFIFIFFFSFILSFCLLYLARFLSSIFITVIFLFHFNLSDLSFLYSFPYFTLPLSSNLQASKAGVAYS
jgi:hypothetical protein